jgi:hypothetical protein
MYIHTIISISAMATVGIIAGSIDYINYIDNKSNTCTETTVIISSNTGSIYCKNGHQEVFKQPNGYFIVHCSCQPILPTTEENFKSENYRKSKPHPYGLDTRIF